MIVKTANFLKGVEGVATRRSLRCLKDNWQVTQLGEVGQWVSFNNYNSNHLSLNDKIKITILINFLLFDNL